MTVVNLPNGQKVRFPDGMSPADIEAELSKIVQPPEDSASPASMLYSSEYDEKVKPPNIAQQALRRADSFAGGLSDSITETAAAIPELSASVARGVGLPAPTAGTYTKGLQAAMKAPGRMAGDAVNSVAGDVIGNLGERDQLDEVFRGMGRGAGDAAAVMVPGAALGKFAKAGGVTSNVGKVLSSQPVAQTIAGMVGGGVSEATDNPYLGMTAAMATPVVASGVRRAVSPVRSALQGEEARLAKLAEKYGIKLTAGQATGSRPLSNAESTMQQMPFTAGPQREIFDGQRKAFNRAVLKTAGINADNAAPETLDNAFRSIGAKFDDLVSKTEITVDKKFIDDINDVVAKSARYMGADNAKILKNYAEDVSDLAKALNDPRNNRVLIDGQAYKDTATSLREALRSTTDSKLSKSLGALISKLDDAVERSMGKELRNEWKDVRNKYRNLLTINKAAEGTQSSRSAGDIAFGSLSRAVKQADKSGYGRGRGDLNDLSRVGDFLADKIPNSGTPERSAMMRLLSGGGVGTSGAVGGGGTAMALGADPQTAALIGMGTAAGQLAMPRLAQALMNSQAGQAYFKNTVANQAGPTRELLAKILAAQGKTPALEGVIGQIPQSR